MGSALRTDVLCSANQNPAMQITGVVVCTSLQEVSARESRSRVVKPCAIETGSVGVMTLQASIYRTEYSVFWRFKDG